MNPFWEIWHLYHKCIFDGENKLIIVSPSATAISVKIDIYSAWKEWARIEANGRFLPAIRVTGGDPIGGGAYTGDVYFLINGWRILIDHSCDIDGVIYSDDFPSPLWAADQAQIVTNKVSSLVSVVETSTGAAVDAAAVASAVWNSPTRLITNDIPNVVEIADAVRTELSPEMMHLMTLENNQGLTPTQATMLLELYQIMGLDPTKPLVVTQSARTAGTSLQQTISTNNSNTIVTRI